MKPSPENYSGKIQNEETPDEPLRSSGSSGKIFFPEEYIDTDSKNKTWCSYMERGFRASRNMTASGGTPEEGVGD